MVRYKAVREKEEEKPNKKWCEEALLPAMFKNHRPAFVEILEEFEGMSDMHLRRIDVSEHRVGVFNDEFRPLHSVTYPAGPAVRQSAAAEVSGVLAESFFEPSSTEWAPPIVLDSKKTGLLRYLVDYREWNAVTICY